MAGTVEADSSSMANPIRKVVTMLQAMEKKVREEGEKEEQLFKKFMCYCKTGGSSLGASIGAGGEKVPQVESDIKQGEAEKAQLDEDLSKHQTDRVTAKTKMEEATGIRNKEATAYAGEKTELDTNIGSVNKAVTALTNGMAGSFLQTNAAQLLKTLINNRNSMVEDDRQVILSFLSASDNSDYTPQSGEVTGILKSLGDEMKKTLADLTATETGSVKVFEELMAAKTKEVNALTSAIEEKTRRTGELAVSIVMMKNDLTDTQAALMEDRAFLAELSSSCKTKEAEWDVRVKLRADELVALAETIKVLNDDDALELFKKTLPGAASSLVQVDANIAAVRVRALAAIRAVPVSNRKRLDFIVLALKGRKIGFEKVIKMIVDMIGTLKTEQIDDDNKREYCAIQFDSMDDKKKGLERRVSDAETAIENAIEEIATLKDEIKALGKGIQDLDKSVAEGSEQRKEEHADYSELMASNGAAKELLGFAKNRLNKFYNPKLYKGAAKRELTEDERISVNMGGTMAPTPAPGGIAGTGVTVFAQTRVHVMRHREDPGPAPETFGDYKTKGQETTGVIAMVDLLIKDLDKEMTEAETQEKDSQSDYEAMMRDSATKRALDAKSLTEKTGAKADAESNLEAHKDEKISTSRELMATMSVIQSLHAECDWLIQYYDMRKEARGSEIDALGKAKAVLSGADFSFVQAKSQKFLKRSA